MKQPLRDAVDSHKEHISFHTPAHGGGMRFSPLAGAISLSDDITELSYSGNLFSSKGAVTQSAAEVSRVFGSDHTFFSTAGATAAVHTAINSLRDTRFLVAGAAHLSVFAALRLSKSDAYYYSNIDNIEDAIIKTRAGTVIVTSPDYFGKVLPLKEIAEAAKRQNAVLIVDASHGSHFAFSSKLPISATVYGDIVIHSLHKTLPVLTGGALLHCRKAYKDRLFAAFSDTHTTSPSYPVMLSIENAVREFSQNGELLYDKVLAEIDYFTKNLPPPFIREDSGDPTRLVINSPYCGGAVAEYLENNGVFPETSLGNYIIFIVTPYNCQYLKRVTEILKSMSGALPPYKEESIASSKRIIRLKSYTHAEYVSLDEAAGKRLYKEIGIYPPGIPLFFAGEIITKEKILFIKRNANRMFGLDNCRIAVVK